MKSIKTYEGFLDFFKRKPKSDKPVYMDDILECGYDLLHDDRIESWVDGKTPPCIGPDLDSIFATGGLMKGPEGLLLNYFGGPRNVRGNIMIVQFRYALSENRYVGFGNRSVPREEIANMLEEFVGKLSDFDCKASFFLAWGYDEGRTDDREFKSVEKVLEAIYKTERTPLVTMKITAPSIIIVD
jgi:hypothetical protein